MAGPLLPSKGALLDIDHILPMVGEFGRYQIIIQSMFCITMVPQALQILIIYFAALNSGWMCVANSTICRLNGTITTDNDHYKDRCSMPRSEWMHLIPEDFSIVTDFDLYCKRESFVYLSTSVFFLGMAFGSIVIGWLADTYGRRKVLYPCMSLVILIGFLSIWSPNIELFIVSRALVGFFTAGTGIQMFIMANELVGHAKRPLVGNMLWMFFALGFVILGVKGYFFRKWKILFIMCTVPYLFVIAFYKFVPESIRWLYVHGKEDEVMKILKKIAHFNKKEFPDVKLAPLPAESTSGVTKKKTLPLDIFRPKKMAISTLIQGFGCYVNALVYYGVALAADDFGGNIYVNFILSTLADFPACLCAIDFCKRFGRKKTTIYAMFIGGLACVIVSLIPSGTSITHWNALRITLGVIGKFCITLSYDAIYTWCLELYPTAVRAEGMGFMQITSRAGAASAPWIAKSLRVVHIILPFSLMGGVTFASAILLFFLPETKGMATRERVCQAYKDEGGEAELVSSEGKDETKQKDTEKMLNTSA